MWNTIEITTNSTKNPNYCFLTFLLFLFTVDLMDWKYVGEAGLELKSRNSHSMGVLTSSSSSSPSSSSSSSSSYSPNSVMKNSDNEDENQSESENKSENKNVSYLVIYGGASPEEGPMGDTVYAVLPQPEDIGELMRKRKL